MISGKKNRLFFHPSSSGFTLIELLVVISIITILGLLAFPFFQSAILNSKVTVSTTNLRQIGTGFTLAAADNDGRFPATASSDNVSTAWTTAQTEGWWTQDVAVYLSGGEELEFDEVPSVFVDPVYVALSNGTVTDGYGGYSMNDRMGLSVGDHAPADDDDSSRNRSYNTARYLATTVLLVPGSLEGAEPGDDGMLPETRLTESMSDPVQHMERISGRSALYLFVDGSVQNLTPIEAAEFLAYQP